MNSSGYSSDWLGDALGISPRFNRVYTSLTSDSRKSAAGSLFVALPGEKFDGHDFILAAVASGAEAVLADFDRIPAGLPANVEIFAVKNTLDAYRKLAASWRSTFSIPVIAVAGSVGKTTTKELLSAILRGRFRSVASTVGSQNGYVGIPMTLLSIPPTTEAAVIEVGIDEPGAMAEHLKIVVPTHSLLTAIGPEHLEKLIDLETVAREEGLALSIPAESNATLIVRLDDPWIRKIADDLPSHANVWTCILKDPVPADVDSAEKSLGKSLLDKFVRGDYLPGKEAIKVTLPDGSGFELSLPLPGIHNAGNLLTAVTAALSLSLSPIEIQRGLSTFQGVFGRSELKMLPGPTPVLCDYYNANPTSVAAALDVLKNLSVKYHSRKRIAALGDMLELGPEEETFHRELAAKILAAKIDVLLLFGKRMVWLADELKKIPGLPKVAHFSDQAALGAALAREIRAGDAVLIKGSRSMKMETAWEAAFKMVEPTLLAEATVTGTIP
ncbi:MAG: UDP-N-acetylmuramoyl-tripeptide--D-alanyl-D-alanine ligase [Cryobacterium sp.]|nr:UDP-N-acetylmuramoyl-tripeptide--D-alanyl-D-alanine ligase [Oligoflexia bacterium]